MKRLIENSRHRIYELAGMEFDVESNAAVAKVLFDDLGLPPVRKTEHGYSVDDDVLEKLTWFHPVVAEILHYRSLVKAFACNPDGGSWQWLEFDDFGRLVGGGTDETYDRYAAEVQNGEGYYDSNGRYRSYGSEWD